MREAWRRRKPRAWRASAQPGVVRRPTSDYTTSSPAALLAYLVAEQLARRGRWPEAIDSLTSAVSHDSTFGLAYYGLLRAIAWGSATPIVRMNWSNAPSTLTVDMVFDAAARHRDRAPPRQRRLLEALAMTNRVHQLRAMDELSRAYPDDADIALEAGDAFFHQGLQMGESPREALGRLERAIVLDPGAPEPYLHVVQLHSMLGDSANAWRTYRRLQTVAPGWEATPGLELTLRALRGEDPATLPADADALRRAARYVLWCADAQPARAIAIADAFTTRLTGPGSPVSDRVPALLRRQLFAIAQGRTARAWDQLQEAASLDPEGPEVLGATVMHHLVTHTHGPQAAEAEELRGRIAERRGDRAAAIRAWRNVVDLWKDADPALQPRVAAARTALARLE